MSQRTILVVEDDAAIRRGLCDSLNYAGFAVQSAATAGEARAAFRGGACDLVLLDVMLPGGNGFELLAELRRLWAGIPVIFVTARGAEEERVRGLRCGADDYVVKPFGTSELLARVEAVLRRTAERPSAVRWLRTSDGRTVNFERREVELSDNSRRLLSEKELELLRYLAGSRGRAIAREELLARVWGLDPRGIETRTIDMHIARLREKIADPAGAGRLLLTVRAKGYMLAKDVEVGLA